MTDGTAIADRLEAIESKLDSLGTATPRWLTIKGSADYSSLSQESIRRLISSGKLTACRPVRGRILLDRNELDSVISTATKTPRRGRGFQRLAT